MPTRLAVVLIFAISVLCRSLYSRYGMIKIHWKQCYTETVSDRTLLHNEIFQVFSETPNGMQARLPAQFR